MVDDPFNPSQSIGPDDSFKVVFDERTAPIATMLQKRMRESISAAKTIEEYTQAANDTFEAIFTALAWLEYRLLVAESSPRIGDE